MSDIKEINEDMQSQVTAGTNTNGKSNDIFWFKKGNCFINKNYPNDHYFVPYEQFAPSSKYDFIKLEYYDNGRHEWAPASVMYYQFDENEGIFVYHPELNNVNYK